MSDEIKDGLQTCEERTTVSVEHALEVCSMFASQTPNRGTEHVCVRPDRVEGTNGHVLMVLPIQKQEWMQFYRLIAADHAMIAAKAGDVDQLQMRCDAQDGVGEFPNTGKMISELENVAPVFSCRVNPFYLELIGKAFGMLGIDRVQLVFRGDLSAIEIIGLTRGGPTGKAFLMPTRPCS